MLSSLCGHCLPSCQAERQAPGLLVLVYDVFLNEYFSKGNYFRLASNTLLLASARLPISLIHRGQTRLYARTDYDYRFTGCVASIVYVILAWCSVP